jgi:hypothetical protein
MNSIIKKLSAWLPIAMSLTALAIVLGYVAIFGIVHEADEGTAAHLFQLLMGGQVPIVAFFAIRWLPQTPKQAAGPSAPSRCRARSLCSCLFSRRIGSNDPNGLWYKNGT